MPILKLLFCVTLLSPFLIFSQNNNKTTLEFIEKYKEIAIKEMARKGIPASIKMGQAILESASGTSELSRSGNNFFGIKCGKEWTGDFIEKEDDDYDQEGKLIKSCFRKFESPEASFVAHSEFITDPKKYNRYGFLFQFSILDYKSWAHGLKRAGYFSNPNVSESIINTIEKYKLYLLDINNGINYDLFATNGITKLNDLKVLILLKPMTLVDISNEFDVKIERLVRFNNGLPQLLTEKLPINSKIYLQDKRKYWRGVEKFHIVQKGENIFDIAQNYGIQLVKLYDKNRIPFGSQVIPGEKLLIGYGTISQKDSPKYYYPKASVVVSTESVTKNDSMFDFVITPINLEKKPSTDTLIITKPKEEPKLEVKIDPIVEEKTKVILEKPIETKKDSTIIVENKPEPSNDGFYIVKIGDTMYSISKKNNLSVDKLKLLNNMSDNNIKVGQKLKIK
jgi:LysM repeat protein